MPNPFRTLSILRRPSPRARSAGKGAFAALVSLIMVQASQSAHIADEPSLRDRSSGVARQVLAAVGHRLVAPVRLVVLNDSSDAILGGFSEALTEAGHDVRLEPAGLQTGTLWTVRRTMAAEGGGEGLEVRVEQWPERSVIYNRLWLAEAAGVDEASDGLMERVVVPLTVGVAAALIVYLFFTVRS